MSAPCAEEIMKKGRIQSRNKKPSNPRGQDYQKYTKEKGIKEILTGLGEPPWGPRKEGERLRKNRPICTELMRGGNGGKGKRDGGCRPAKFAGTKNIRTWELQHDLNGDLGECSKMEKWKKLVGEWLPGN